MNPPEPAAQARLDAAVRAFTAEAKALYGREEADILAIAPRMIELGAQDRLYGELQGALGFDVFARPIRYLEAGCGTSTFLLSVMGRGNDAYGIDMGSESLELGRSKIPYYNLPAEWNERIVEGDASATPFESNAFDLVVGHQFIEHVDHIPATMQELVRVTKPGGHIVLWAPDYRGPYEAHYMLPWPIFPTRPMAECWAESFERPFKGLSSFNYVTLPQLIAIAQVLGCDVLRAWNDRAIDPNAHAYFATSSLQALRDTAQRMKAQLAAGTLPPHLSAPTSLGITLKKR